MTLTEAVGLTRRYSRKLGATAATAAAATATIWDQLGSWDDVDVERFAASALPVVAGAQRAASALTGGYIALLVGDRPRPVDSKPFLELVDLTEPFVAYWAHLGQGMSWAEAITAGRSRAEQVTLDGITSAARGTSTEIDRQEDRIIGWERVPGGRCCEWCALVSTQRYHTADSADFGHARCNCAVTPIVGDLRPGRVINEPLLDTLRTTAPSDRTGYVDGGGNPTARPGPTPIEEP